MIILTKINQLDNIDTITDKLKADISQSISILNTAKISHWIPLQPMSSYPAPISPDISKRMSA